MKFDLNIVDILNLPVRILAALTLASGFMLLLPSKFLAKIQLTGFIDKYGFTIGLIFIVSLSILVVTLVIQIANFISNKISLSKFKKNAETRLRQLTPFEMCIVLSLFENENYTNLLPIHDGAVRKIENELIIGKLTNQYVVSNPNTAKFPYFLQKWVIDELKNKPDLLKLFENTAEEFLKSDNNKELVFTSLVKEPDYF